MKTLKNISLIDEFVKSGDIRMLYLSRPDCGVCKALIPKIEELIKIFPEMEAGYIDLDQNPEAAGKFSIFTIPGILVYIKGKESIRKARYISTDELKDEINRYHELLIS
jgi:thiol-disulfide isomerase/thioredoxin